VARRDPIDVRDATTGEVLEVENVRVLERPECPPSLPSSTATRALLAGEPGGAAAVAFAVAGRALIIGAGMKLAKPRRRARKIARDALAGALAIQAFVVAIEASEARRRRRGR
jgi:hypothetical protein